MSARFPAWSLGMAALAATLLLGGGCRKAGEAPPTDRVTGAGVLHATTEANDLRVVIEPAQCTDIMSGKPFETTVTVTLNKQTYHGCGGPLK